VFFFSFFFFYFIIIIIFFCFCFFFVLFFVWVQQLLFCFSALLPAHLCNPHKLITICVFVRICLPCFCVWFGFVSFSSSKCFSSCGMVHGEVFQMGLLCFFTFFYDVASFFLLYVRLWLVETGKNYIETEIVFGYFLLLFFLLDLIFIYLFIPCSCSHSHNARTNVRVFCVCFFFFFSSFFLFFFFVCVLFFK